MVLILGSGFIGNAIHGKLLEFNYPVRIFSKNILDNPKGNYYRGDFNQIEKYQNLFDGVSTVIHTIHSTVPATSMSNLEYEIDSSVKPSLKLLDILKKKSLKNLIYISSGGALYGNPLYLPVNETHPTYPI